MEYKPNFKKVNEQYDRWWLDDEWFIDRIRDQEFIKKESGIKYWLCQTKDKNINLIEEDILFCKKAKYLMGNSKSIKDLWELYQEKKQGITDIKDYQLNKLRIGITGIQKDSI